MDCSTDFPAPHTSCVPMTSKGWVPEWACGARPLFTGTHGNQTRNVRGKQ
jgi:hypothetical protein